MKIRHIVSAALGATIPLPAWPPPFVSKPRASPPLKIPFNR